MAPLHSAVEPAGPQAAHIETLLDGYVDVSILVFILVIGALVAALARKKQPEDLRPKRRAVGAATAVTVVTLIALLVVSAVTGRALASLSTTNAVQIQIVGHRWWWEVWYPDRANVSNTFKTAYEIHIPVGRPAEIQLSSDDVIHSFWVPSLHGKRDAIPGKTSTLVLRADEPGVYDGMCAEFCGVQHANMRFRVIAEPEDKFQAWLAHSRQPAGEPKDDVEKHGQQVFLKSRCAYCHTVSGTNAAASVGPDLTHVASRSALAMGTLANTPGHLAGWIVDPQSSKPGVQMPGTPLPPEDLQALLTYLRSLQ